MKTKINLLLLFVSSAFYAQGVIYQTTTPGTPSNVRIGVGAGNISTNGLNTFIGTNTGASNTTGEYNTFLGFEAGKNNIDGNHNTIIGARWAGQGNTSGSSNVIIGMESGLNTSTGSYNTFVGPYSGTSNGSGNYNVYLGFHAKGGLGSQKNVAIGFSAGQYSSGSSNILIGDRSGLNTTGSTNVMIGTESGKNITSGADNIFLGTVSGLRMTSGTGNLLFGGSAGVFLDSGVNNTMIGNGSGSNLINGSFNTFLGRVTVSPTTISNTVILADGEGKQRLYISNAGNAGIGLDNNVIPQNKLEVKSDAANTSGLRFTNLKNTFNPALTVVATKFLTVDANGDVVLQHSKNIYTHDGDLLSNRIVSMKDKSLIFDTDNDGRIYIGNTGTLPFNTTNFPTTSGKYRLYVEGGILTEKVKVAMKNPSTNWADYVFADDYKLMPLNEIETFVKENKHLPGIESADELVKSGLDLGEMQAKQMGKIEELTLYVIEQEKKLKQQNAILEKQNDEIEELKAQMKMLMEKK